ncbi:hypothetical protein E3Q11_00835 [Wallemia mellicola]|nr:hypothetical protein E3Q11_00835 [Wallemia mellicola]TIC75277.1 hypothetical protein E3Q00_00993 [Wallemia mellicola]
MESSLIITNLDKQTINLLDEIISIVPPSSHSFLALFNAYNQVLDAHGIDQNDEVELYDLLLKLGVVKGKDWHERWQSILNSDYNTTHPLVDIDDQDSASVSSSSGSSASTHSDTRSTSTAALAAEARQTDEEFPPIQYNNQRNRVPTTVQARALASVQAQTKRVRQAELIRRQQEQERLKRTEEARKRELEEARQRADENKVLREMEFMADSFHRSNVTSRTFNVWFGLFRWIQHNHQQVKTTQTTQILNTYFQKWEHALSKRVILANHVAISQDKMRTMSTTLSKWRAHLKHRARHRKEARLRSTFSAIRKNIAKRLIQESWQTWRDLTMTRRADLTYSYNLMSVAFGTWKKRTIGFLALDSVVIEFATTVNERRAATMFRHWKQQKELQTKERGFQQDRTAVIIRKTFETWKYKNDTNKAAIALRNASSIRNAFYGWQRKLYRIQKYTAISDAFIEDSNNRLKQQTIYQWQLSMKCFNFQLGHMRTLSQAVLQYWYQKVSYIQKLNLKADTLHFDKIRTLGVSLFDKWKVRTAELKEKSRLAQEYSDLSVQQNALKVWMKAYRNKRLLNRRGHVLRRMIQKKNSFHTWRFALSRKRQNALIKKHELDILQNTWTVWRAKFNVLCDLRVRENAFKAEHIHKSMTSVVLQQWLHKTIERKDLIYSADIISKQKTKRSVVQNWRSKVNTLRDLESLAVSHEGATKKKLQAELFSKWLKQTRATVVRNRKCEEFVKRREQTILFTAFEDWFDQIKIIELEPVETEMLILRRERMLRMAFERWKETATALPAVQLYNRRLKERTLDMWKSQLPCARNTRLAVQIYRRDCLVRWLHSWRDALQIKRSRRAIARARALGKRPSASRLKAREGSTPSPDPFAMHASRKPFAKVNRLY